MTGAYNEWYVTIMLNGMNYGRIKLVATTHIEALTRARAIKHQWTDVGATSFARMNWTFTFDEVLCTTRSEEI